MGRPQCSIIHRREMAAKTHLAKWHQKLTIFPFCPSKLENWQWPSGSCCIAGHREVHQEKKPHFSKQLAQGCWKLKKTYLNIRLPTQRSLGCKVLAKSASSLATNLCSRMAPTVHFLKHSENVENVLKATFEKCCESCVTGICTWNSKTGCDSSHWLSMFFELHMAGGIILLLTALWPYFAFSRVPLRS